MDRRQLGEDNYRQKFEAFGLSGRFEFIRREWSKDHDKRFWSRCKTCGAEFLSWNEVFKGRQSRLICPNCGTASDGADIWARSKSADEAAEYYTQGHSVKETAERFGVTEWQINNLAWARGLTNGRKFYPGFNDKSAQLHDEAKARLIKTLKTKGFEYLGGYDNKDSRIRMRCIRCGDTIERRYDTIKDGAISCPECKEAEKREKQEQDRKRRALEAEQRKKEQEARQKQREIQCQEEKDQKLDAVYVCKICGKEYTPREYMASAGLVLFSNVGCCSEACKRKHNHRLSKECKKKRGVRDSHRHRAKKYGVEYDPTVTLDRLIQRDGLRCALCGEMCDPNDHRDTKYSGPLSPSMDHIIPMAKGGGHVWDNVQVAHRICNSIKGAKILDTERNGPNGNNQDTPRGHHT